MLSEPCVLFIWRVLGSHRIVRDFGNQEGGGGNGKWVGVAVVGAFKCCSVNLVV